MPRPASGARERILETTLVLLREGGLSAAGLNDMVGRSAAPKGSLYHYFPAGKTQIVIEALEVYAPRVGAQIARALASRHPLPRRIKALFSATADRMQSTGFRESCAVGAVVLDLADADAELRSRCAAILDGWALTAAAGLPELPSARRPAAGRHLISLLEGAQLQSRARQSPQPLLDAAAAFSRYAATWIRPAQ